MPGLPRSVLATRLAPSPQPSVPPARLAPSPRPASLRPRCPPRSVPPCPPPRSVSPARLAPSRPPRSVPAARLAAPSQRYQPANRQGCLVSALWEACGSLARRSSGGARLNSLNYSAILSAKKAAEVAAVSLVRRVRNTSTVLRWLLTPVFPDKIPVTTLVSLDG